MDPVHLVDPSDARLDAFRDLRGRESADVLWAEGPTVVERALAAPSRVHAVLLTPAAHARLAPLLAGHPDVAVLVADQAVVNAVVGFDLHRGVIAVGDRPALSDLAALAAGGGTIVAIEGVNDPENLGAIARSARGLGAAGLLLDPTCPDPWYRRTVRVSMGEVLHLPVARAPLGDALDTLVADGFTVWALTPRADAVSLGRLTPPDRLVVVVGAEGPGLSATVLDRHLPVRIPMRAEVDSLNVGHAVAAALAVIGARRPDSDA